MTFQFEVFPVVGPDDNPRANGKVFQLLRAVRETGSLHRAAKQVGLSYRHAWGVMRSWEEMLGRALLDMERGRGASLTLFGERMLRAEMRLREQIDPATLNGETAITTFVFEVKNVPAALYKALGCFATNGVNMTKLESYQDGASFAATMFYADIVGAPGDPAIDRALEELAFHSKELRMLGSYRQARDRG